MMHFLLDLSIDGSQQVGVLRRISAKKMLFSSALDVDMITVGQSYLKGSEMPGKYDPINRYSKEKLGDYKKREIIKCKPDPGSESFEKWKEDHPIKVDLLTGDVTIW